MVGRALVICSSFLVADASKWIQWVEHPSLCLDIKSEKYENGAKLQLWECSSVDGAAPTFATGSGAISWGDHPDMCIDIQGEKKENGTPIQMWSCSGPDGPAPEFIMPETGHGMIRWSAHPDFCLDIKDEKPQNGAQIQLWECNGSRGPAPLFQLATPTLPSSLEVAEATACLTGSWAGTQTRLTDASIHDHMTLTIGGGRLTYTVSGGSNWAQKQSCTDSTWTGMLQDDPSMKQIIRCGVTSSGISCNYDEWRFDGQPTMSVV